MTVVTLEEAASRLGELIDRAGSGEEIMISRDGQAVAQILSRRVEPAVEPLKRREGGQWEGKVWIADDFDEWTDELDEMFGMKDA